VEALGVAGAPAPNRLTTTFRLPGGVLVDAGAAAHGLERPERENVAFVLLSHAHLDHTLGLPFLLANAEPQVYASKETLEAVRSSLLDGRIWPDLSERAGWNEVVAGRPFRVGPWEVEAGPSAHTVPTSSFHFSLDGGGLALVGDTRLDEEVVAWVARRRPATCVVECSYPDPLAEYGLRYGHQTTRDLRAWRAALGPDCRLLVTHRKPFYEESVRAECEALSDPDLVLLSDGDVFEV
jgi:ribonuclease BN (tRNA processing enzyme)